MWHIYSVKQSIHSVQLIENEIYARDICMCIWRYGYKYLQYLFVLIDFEMEGLQKGYISSI